jgi:hypothetical protein
VAPTALKANIRLQFCWDNPKKMQYLKRWHRQIRYLLCNFNQHKIATDQPGMRKKVA